MIRRKNRNISDPRVFFQIVHLYMANNHRGWDETGLRFWLLPIL